MRQIGRFGAVIKLGALLLIALSGFSQPGAAAPVSGPGAPAGVALFPHPAPTLPEPLVIGYSVAGRPLNVYRFGNGPRRRMVVAGIHGGSEANTIALAGQLIAYYAGHPLPQDNITLFILPALNPDGAARAEGVDGRVNEHGVDLNRNWPYRWARTWPVGNCWHYRPVHPGWRPASEPETTALMAFLLNQRIEALISYHSAALGIFAGGIPPDAASISLAEALAAVSDYPYPPVDIGCVYTGNLADWAAANGIAAVDIELSDHEHAEFLENLAILRVFFKWR